MIPDGRRAVRLTVKGDGLEATDQHEIILKAHVHSPTTRQAPPSRMAMLEPYTDGLCEPPSCTHLSSGRRFFNIALSQAACAPSEDR